jgi:hypothetical protein
VLAEYTARLSGLEQAVRQAAGELQYAIDHDRVVVLDVLARSGP